MGSVLGECGGGAAGWELPGGFGTRHQGEGKERPCGVLGGICSRFKLRLEEEKPVGREEPKAEKGWEGVRWPHGHPNELHKQKLREVAGEVQVGQAGGAVGACTCCTGAKHLPSRWCWWWRRHWVTSGSSCPASTSWAAAPTMTSAPSSTTSSRPARPARSPCSPMASPATAPSKRYA